MRKLFPVLVALAALWIAVLGPCRGRADRNSPTEGEARGPQLEASTQVDQPNQRLEAGELDPLQTAPERGAVAALEHETAVEVSEPDANCILTARVLDENGEPLVSVQAQLFGYQVWAEGLDVPRLAGRYDLRGFEVQSDVTGRLRFEVPPPTNERTALRIQPDRFHDSHEVRFQANSDHGQPALTAGLRDLGELRLARTGAVQGRVTDERGNPLADVKMGLGPKPGQTYGRNARSAADGSYLIPHAPVGRYGVSATSGTHLRAFIEPVTVEAGRDTTGVDFVLQPAPTIEGFVVDEAGAALEGVRFFGWPARSGRGASGKSDARGHFVVYLPQEDPYTLSAKLDGYRKWGDENKKSTVHQPGTRDLRVVMQAMAKTRFLVSDALTGDVIEDFGIAILEDNGSQARPGVHTERYRPAPTRHEGGIAEANARPGVDLYLIYAEGYLLASADVAEQTHDEPQVVRLQRGSTLTGRVLRGQEPVADARISVVRAWMPDGHEFEARPKYRAHGTDRPARTLRGECTRGGRPPLDGHAAAGSAAGHRSREHPEPQGARLGRPRATGRCKYRGACLALGRNRAGRLAGLPR